MVLKINYAAFKVVIVSKERKVFCRAINCSQPLTLLNRFSAQSRALALQRRIIRAPFQRLTRRARWASCSKQFSIRLVLERLRANLWGILSRWTVKVSSKPSNKLLAAIGQDSCSQRAV